MRGVAFVVAGAVVLLIALACGPPPGPSCNQSPAFQASFHFESDCMSDLCGFSVVTGSARRAETFHPGEHGMQIDANSSVSIAFNGPSVSRGGEQVTLIARCDDGATLVATETIIHAATSTTPSHPEVVTTPVPAQNVYVPQFVTFFSASGTTSSGEMVSAAGLEFDVTGTGSCTVDEIHYSALQQLCSGVIDSGTDASDGFGRDAADAPHDGPDASALLFSQCSNSAMCTLLGAGAQCITQYPGGICTRRCTTDSNCGGAGLCLQGICFPRCQQGDLSCDRFGADCVEIDPADPTRRICNPSCFPSGSTPPSASYPLCPPSASCDPYSGVCGGPFDGPVNGAPCTMDADCRGGSCILENSPATGATGFLGGYCVSFARRPPDSAYVEGSAIPQSNCPIGSAPFPSSDTTEGDGTTCFATCDGSHPCRPGYQCDHLEDTATHAPYFTNGFCLPLDCNRSGMACPSGYTCTTPPSDAAMPVGICVASGADGGTPDGGLADAASGG